MKIISNFNGLTKGQPVKLLRNVYQRQDGTPYGGIYYEPPGYLIAQRDTIGRFSGLLENGRVLVYIDNGVGSVLGLVLDQYAIEPHKLNS